MNLIGTAFAGWHNVPRLMQAVLCALCASMLMTEVATAHDPSKIGELKVKAFPKTKQVLLYWKGRIAKPMAREFQVAIDKMKDKASRGFIVSLHSRGGIVKEAEKVIAILRRLKETHTVRTYVGRGKVCGSMCVPVFLVGGKRSVAFASLWLFHDISGLDKNDKSRKIFKPWKTAKMFRDYFVPAGVPQFWIDAMKAKIKGSDYWMTGAELLSSNSKIGTHFVTSHKKRKLKQPKKK